MVSNEEILAESSKYEQWQRASEINLAMNIAKSRERFRWALGYSTALCMGTSFKWIFTLKFPIPMLLPISASILYAGNFFIL